MLANVTTDRRSTMVEAWDPVIPNLLMRIAQTQIRE